MPIVKPESRRANNNSPVISMVRAGRLPPELATCATTGNHDKMTDDTRASYGVRNDNFCHNFWHHYRKRIWPKLQKSLRHSVKVSQDKYELTSKIVAHNLGISENIPGRGPVKPDGCFSILALSLQVRRYCGSSGSNQNSWIDGI